MQALMHTKQRLSGLQHAQQQSSSMYFDFVQWDCQNLPLRDGIVDVFLADLPISGGTSTNKTKEHFTPTINGENLGSPSTHLNYRVAIQESLRVLRPGSGRASFISVDANSLKHGMLSYDSCWFSIP